MDFLENGASKNIYLQTFEFNVQYFTTFALTFTCTC